MKHLFKKLVVYMVLISMMTFFGALPLPQAQAVDSITSARDLMSESDPAEAGVTHIFTFTTGTTTPASGYWRISFPVGFTGVASGNATCGYGEANLVEGGSGQNIDCTATGNEVATTTQVVVTNVTNPGTTGSYTITLTNRNSSGTILEQVDMMVYIIDNVLMTARVSSALTFTVSGTSTDATVNGADCDLPTTATTTDFGTLTVNASTTVCQILNVTTNATEGYIVTVEQDDELRSSGNDTINSFNNSPDGTGSSTPQAWSSPTSELDHKYTYGHMGLTSNDTDLNSLGGYNDFSGEKYVGFDGYDNPIVVMHHNGPADGLTQDKGEASVAYTAEVGFLQEAGDYQNVLTYIATPTF